MKLVTLLLFICILGQQNNTPNTPQPNEPVSIQLSTDKKTYYVGEPIYFTISLQNNQDIPLKANFNIPSNLIVCRGIKDELFFRYRPVWVQLLTKCCITAVEIPSQSSWNGKGRLFYNSRFLRHILSEPGEYELKVDLGKSDIGPITYDPNSNIVKVKVLPPPEKERSAFADLSDQTLAGFLEGDVRINWGKEIGGRDLVAETEKFQAGVEKALAFLAQYPKSLYAPIVEKMTIQALADEANRSGGKLPTKELQAIYESLRSGTKRKS